VSRGIAVLFLGPPALDGGGGQPHARAASTPAKDPVPIVQKAGWAPGPVCISSENLVPTGIRSPDRPARNQLLYRLNYRAYSGFVTLRNIQESCTNFVINLNCRCLMLRSNLSYFVLSSGATWFPRCRSCVVTL